MWHNWYFCCHLHQSTKKSNIMFCHIFKHFILMLMSQVINFLYFLFINVYFTPFLAFIYIFIHLLNSTVFNDTVQAFYCLYNVLSNATNENSKYVLYIHSVLFSVIKRTIRNFFDVTGCWSNQSESSSQPSHSMNYCKKYPMKLSIER